MGRIVRAASGTPVRLNRRTLFGRAFTGATHLFSNEASKEHACIDWDGEAWVLRDLNSRNGTRINDMPLESREWRLSIGDRIAFGSPSELWTWAEDGSPCPYALESGGGEVMGSHSLLALPDETSPVVTIYARPDSWELDDGHAQRAVAHDDVVTVAGREFRLQLPETASELVRTRTNRARPHVVSGRALFKVSPDEEHVEVQLGTGGEGALHVLPRRAFGYALLTLARRREHDRTSQVTQEEAGWMHTDDLAAGLGTTPEKLNVDVHRLRHVVAALGVFNDPNSIVERRPGQLRIGIAELTIRRNTGFEAASETPPVEDQVPQGGASKRLA
jgi:hypothetical protein